MAYDVCNEIRLEGDAFTARMDYYQGSSVEISDAVKATDWKSKRCNGWYWPALAARSPINRLGQDGWYGGSGLAVFPDASR